MNITVETITPEIASEMLKHLVPDRQRKLSRSVVENYARMMKLGLWKLTHQGIGFDVSGELIDGQHRLHAIVESGATVQMLVARDIEGEHAIDCLDRGEERTVAQQLTLRHGFPHGAPVSCLCRKILACCLSSQFQNPGKFNVSYALSVYEEYADDINFVLSRRSTEKGFRGSIIQTAAAFAMGTEREKARTFYVDLLQSRIKHDKGDPILVLRKFLEWNHNRAFKSEIHGVKTVLTCMMHYCKGEKMDKVYDSNNGMDFFLCGQREKVSKVLTKCGFIG